MVIHAGGLPEGWPNRFALCGQKGERLHHSFLDEEITCKRCNRILEEQSASPEQSEIDEPIRISRKGRHP